MDIIQAQNAYPPEQRLIRLCILADRTSKNEFVQQLVNTPLVLALDRHFTRNKIPLPDNIEKIVQSTIQTTNKLKIEASNQKIDKEASKVFLMKAAEQYNKAGNFEEAQNLYYKVHELNGRSQDYVIPWVQTMIWNQQFTHFRIIQPTEEILQDWLLLSAIRNFIKLDYRQFLADLLKIKVLKIDAITNYQDLSSYIIISAIMTRNQKENIQLLQHPLIQELYEKQPILKQFLTYYIDYDFQTIIASCGKFLQNLKYDVHSLDNVPQIEKKMIEYLMKQYLQSYKRISLVTISQMLNKQIMKTIEWLEAWIIENKLNYKIDPIDQVLIKQSDQESIARENYGRITKKLLQTIDTKYMKYLKQDQ